MFLEFGYTLQTCKLPCLLEAFFLVFQKKMNCGITNESSLMVVAEVVCMDSVTLEKLQHEMEMLVHTSELLMGNC